MINGHSLIKQGKVRSLYGIDKDRILIECSDQVSVFDQVLPQKCDGKGEILNSMSGLWFKKFESDGFFSMYRLHSHFISNDFHDFPKAFQKKNTKNCMIAHKTTPIPIECIVRGYLVPSFVKTYRQQANFWGSKFSADLPVNSPFPQNIFTPTTKGKVDQRLNQREAIDILGISLFNKLQRFSLKLFEYASQILRKVNVTLVDSKFEFGQSQGKIYLIDEIFTPDSSRFWILPGKNQFNPEHFDKQFLRNYVLSQKWQIGRPLPQIPPVILEELINRYKKVAGLTIEALE